MSKGHAITHTSRCDICSNQYQRVEHKQYDFKYPYCTICELIPSSLKARVVFGGRDHVLTCKRNGDKIKTLRDCRDVINEFWDDVESGIRNFDKFKRRTDGVHIRATLEDCEKIIIRKLRLSESEIELMRDWIMPTLGDRGIFTLSDTHLYVLFNTLLIRPGDPRRGPITKLFERILHFLSGELDKIYNKPKKMKGTSEGQQRMVS